MFGLPAGNMRWVRLPTCFALPAATVTAPGGQPLLVGQVCGERHAHLPVQLQHQGKRLLFCTLRRDAVSAVLSAVQMLHGIFVATTSGQMNINPCGEL